MANKTVHLNSQTYAGASNLTLFLVHPTSGSVGNGSGDVLIAGTNGAFSAVVTEAISGWWRIVIKQDGVSVIEGGWVYFPADVLGDYIADNPAVTPVSIAGIGARSVVVTVTDGTNPVAGALVRFSRTGETYVAQTNISGQINFSLNDGTWTMSITAPGLFYAATQQIVDGNEIIAATMSPTGTITPSAAPWTTGYWTVYKDTGDIDPGAIIELQTSAPPSGSGLILEDKIRQGVADAQGVVQFTKLFAGATYIVNRQDSKRKFTVVIPANAGASIALGNILG